MLYMLKLSHAMKNQGSGTNEMDWVNYVRSIFFFINRLLGYE